MKILIIDDDRMVAQSISHFLRYSLDCYVDISTEPQSALQLSYKKCYDIIICDLHMPEYDGFKLINKLQKDVDTEIIVITGYPTIKKVLKAREMGVTHFFTKPIKVDLLAEVICKYKEKRKKEDSL